MKRKKIILVGGGGHCESCIEIIEREKKYEIAGIVDIQNKVGNKILGYEIIASDKSLLKLVKSFKYFLVTIGQIKSSIKRKEKFELLKKNGGIFPAIISPNSVISKTAFVDEGTIVMSNAVINSNVRIGKNCIINTSSLIEHGCFVDDNSHIATGVILNGECRIGKNVFIGSGSILINNIEITSDVVIGAGSLVRKSIKRKGTYAGSPLKRVK